MLGPILIQNYIIPLLVAAREIQAGAVLERIEFLLVIIIISGCTMKICLFYWVAVIGSVKVMKLHDYRSIVLPIGAFIVALSGIVHKNISDMLNFLGRVWPVYAIVLFEAGIPVMLLIASSIRQRRDKCGKVGPF